MTNTRIVVTGLGSVSPYGVGLDSFRVGLFGGRSGVRPIASFDAGTLPVRVAAEVPAFDESLVRGEKRHLRIMNRQMRFGSIATRESLRLAGLEDVGETRTNIACFASVGRGDFSIEEFGEAFRRAFDEQGAFQPSAYYARGYRAIYPLRMLTLIPNIGVMLFCFDNRLEGETFTFTSEGASGIQALATAAEGIREGRFDVAVCGGCEARINPFGLARMMTNGLLAEGDGLTASRPFDRARRGCVLGEGAAFIVLESERHASERGARPIAELAGWGLGSDAHDSTRAHPEGRGLRRSMNRTLEVAALAPEAVDLVVATACASTDLDAAESAAMRSVFASGDGPLVTAPASALGRMQSASGAFNALTAILAIAEGHVPPTLNSTDPDEGSPKNLVLGSAAITASVRTAMANGYAYGGQCGSVLFRRIE